MTTIICTYIPRHIPLREPTSVQLLCSHTLYFSIYSMTAFVNISLTVQQLCWWILCDGWETVKTSEILNQAHKAETTGISWWRHFRNEWNFSTFSVQAMPLLTGTLQIWSTVENVMEDWEVAASLNISFEEPTNLLRRNLCVFDHKMGSTNVHWRTEPAVWVYG